MSDVGLSHTPPSVQSLSSSDAARQQPFARVAPLLGAALLLGAGGGFALAALLTLTSAVHIPIGVWWAATAQAHGHLQVYGWAGLFILGVAFHFLPRQRGAPLAAPWSVSWILGAQTGGLLLRAVSQPLVATTGSGVWRGLLVASGLLECMALLGTVVVLGATAAELLQPGVGQRAGQHPAPERRSPRRPRPAVHTRAGEHRGDRAQRISHVRFQGQNDRP